MRIENIEKGTLYLTSVAAKKKREDVSVEEQSEHVRTRNIFIAALGGARRAVSCRFKKVISLFFPLSFGHLNAKA